MPALTEWLETLQIRYVFLRDLEWVRIRATLLIGSGNFPMRADVYVQLAVHWALYGEHVPWSDNRGVQWTCCLGPDGIFQSRIFGSTIKDEFQLPCMFMINIAG